MESLPRLDLLDWRRQVHALYGRVRMADDPKLGWKDWRRTRDELFRTHPQSPLAANARSSFSGLTYFDYDPACRVTAEVKQAPPEHFDIPTSGDQPMSFERFGTVTFELAGSQSTLDVYWLTVYGGGVFLPLRDATSGRETYGACRYLLDTIKGADLGNQGDELILDFNFAYNPSCSYDSRWVCPLAPPSNRLPIEVRAGEMLLDKS